MVYACSRLSLQDCHLNCAINSDTQRSQSQLVAPLPSMQEGKIELENSLHERLMEISHRGIVVWFCLISITLHSPQAALANESNHKVMARQIS